MSTDTIPTSPVFGRPRRIDTERVRELYERGLTDRAIATELGCSLTAVKEHRHRLGFRLRGGLPSLAQRQTRREEGDARRALADPARAALDAYLELRSAENLKAATVAVEAYCRHYGPLPHRGWLWRIDGVGDLHRAGATLGTERRAR